jgi:hypothetical protein
MKNEEGGGSEMDAAENPIASEHGGFIVKHDERMFNCDWH